MTGPNHLWSGDWRRESAAAAQRLAQRRGPTDAPAEPPAADPPQLRRFHDALAGVVTALRSARPPRVRGGVLIAIATLIAAAAAYAVVAALVSPSSPSSPHAPPPSHSRSASNPGTAWLGVDTTNSPLTSGAMILDVAPGSPADSAGLQPGDVISEIDNRPVQTSGDLDSDLAGLHAGQQVEIGYDRGLVSLTTQATLATRPPGP